MTRLQTALVLALFVVGTAALAPVVWGALTGAAQAVPALVRAVPAWAWWTAFGVAWWAVSARMGWGCSGRARACAGACARRAPLSV